ncbi:MAG: DUF4097 domain-containing protein [Candidatus Aminicenantaceae bacterium]
MNKFKIFACVILLLFAVTVLYAQDKKVDRAAVPFSDPSKPGMIEASVHNGAITVKGYNGKEVIVEARVRGQLLSKEKEVSEQVKGMKRIIGIPITGLTIEEKENVMEVSTASMKNTVDLTIQVPFNTSLELSSHNNGDITVENITGEIEVNHHNGKLTLTNISGAVVAHTFNGAILVTFNKIDPEKPMSFSNWNGDIDVTFPQDLKANVKIHSELGDIYSDYEISLTQSPQKQEKDKRKEGGKYRIAFDKSIYGTINGGGQEIQFKTFHGNILIRKAK